MKKPRSSANNLAEYLIKYKRHRKATRVDISHVLTAIKKRIRREQSPVKKQMWAEIGLELNGLFLALE